MTERIALVTGEDAPELTADGRRLRDALRDRGFEADGARWNDPTVDWTGFDAALIRSCWGYYADLDGFRDWLAGLEDAGVAVRNPPDVVRWNLHKSYLLDLQARGVPVVPTEVVEPGSDRELSGILRDRGWDEAVVKPAVGTSAAGVWKTSLETAREDQERFEAPFPAARQVGDTADPDADAGTLPDRGTLVQRFVPEVAEGELSLVFFGGEFGHAWRSLRADDALGVDPAGAVDGEYDPSPATISAGRDVLRTAAEVVGVDPAALPYARVDYVRPDGEFRLMELELIEPYLSLDSGDRAAEAFAAAVENAL